MLNLKSLSTLALAIVACVSQATIVFSDAGESLANYMEVNGGDATVRVIDYSNFTISGTNHTLAESPNQIAGSANTTGMIFQANMTQGSPTGINLFLGATPLTFNQPVFTLTFDMYMKAPSTVSASTEDMLWGVGRTNTNLLGRFNDNTEGDGVWGFATGDGGSSDDFAINVGTNRTQTFNGIDAIPSNTFTAPPYDRVGSPGGAWSTVKVINDNGTITVYHNDEFFFREVGVPTNGHMFIGYDDAFSSLSSEPGNQWMIIDNVQVDAVPEPITMTLLATGALALLRKRRQK